MSNAMQMPITEHPIGKLTTEVLLDELAKRLNLEIDGGLEFGEIAEGLVEILFKHQSVKDQVLLDLSDAIENTCTFPAKKVDPIFVSLARALDAKNRRDSRDFDHYFGDAMTMFERSGNVFHEAWERR
jgi:hypothetical protein